MVHQNYKTDIIYRVMSRAIKQENGCILYRPGKLKHTYGLISITTNGKRKSVPAHRALYMATHNLWDLDRLTVVRHKCDNPRCVNIQHLQTGTHAENAQDCTDHGRRAKKYRKHTRIRVHSWEKVDAIRAAIGKYKDIAAIHGVSVGYISKIKTGRLKGA